MEYHFITAVWGDSFIDAYLRVVLPMQICPGNLGAFRGTKVLYRIFTPPEDRVKICRSPMYTRLQEIVEVDFVDIQREKGLDNLALMNRCHQLAIKEALKKNAVLIFLSPDCLISNRTFQYLVQSIEQGIRVVMIPALRLKKEIMLPVIESLFSSADIQKEGISSRELVKTALPYLHEISESLFWGKTISSRPSNLYWKLDEGNVLIRGFHLHPLLVWPERRKATSHLTIDDQFVSLACPNKKTWKVVADSDDIAVFEISNRERGEGGLLDRMPCNPWNVAKWTFGGAAPLHRWFVQHRLYMRSTDRSPSWHLPEQCSDEAVRKILWWAKLGFFVPIYKIRELRAKWRIRTRLKRLFSNLLG